MKNHYKYYAIAGVLIAVAGIATVFTQTYADYTTGPQQAEQADNRTDTKAEFSFAVTELSRNGPDVTFTIPENARELDKKADSVVVSGLYQGDKMKSDCPLVQSTDVSKSIEDYNPMTGKARIKAHFDDEALAKEAIEKGCLLINDPT